MISSASWDRLRPFLWPIAMLYWSISWWRNFFYNRGFFIARKVATPIVSIGNLSVGGTGKTPATILIASLLRDYGYRVGVLSRGYGRSSGGTVLVSDGEKTLVGHRKGGDEPLLIAKRLANVAVVVDEDRYRGAVYLREIAAVDVIILDDGFQHRGLDRDCDILLLDSTVPPNHYRIFPYGTLRERLSSIKRAHMIIWTKSNLAEPPLHIRQAVQNQNLLELRSELIAGPELIDLANGAQFPVAHFTSQSVHAFCGIAMPRQFYHTLFNLGIEPMRITYFADHYAYSDKDLQKLIAQAKNADSVLITTEKDGMRLSDLDIPADTIFTLPVQMQFSDSDLRLLQERILKCLPMPSESFGHGEA
ncbi:tetraacyldisaccharide 4'-kinase [Candidatus Neomarinimicrobiota bacterium]